MSITALSYFINAYIIYYLLLNKVGFILKNVQFCFCQLTYLAKGEVLYTSLQFCIPLLAAIK